MISVDIKSSNLCEGDDTCTLKLHHLVCAMCNSRELLHTVMRKNA